MWLGTVLGRLWARLFDGVRSEDGCPDPDVEVWLVSRMFPRWAAGQAWGNVILIRRAWWGRPQTARLVEHEYRHVVQWRRYRNAFLFVYLAGWLWALLRFGPRQAYFMNWMEREARGELDNP